ncbi:MAG: DUF2334 domain-containing protein [Nanoarchaeota archaeon]
MKERHKTNKQSKIFLVILMAVFVFFLIRLLNTRELDDVSPGIECEQKLYNKAHVLWVIPKFNSISISENKTWCKDILSLNKTLGMHGVTHEYEEFGSDKSQEYFDEGVKVFEKCFGEKPTMFKPPQLKISENNKKLIKNNNLSLLGNINQITHKVYHCNDSDIIKNWMVDII